MRVTNPTAPRPFRVPLFPLPPIVFLLGATALLVGAFGDLGETAWLSFGVMLLGLPVGLAWQRFQPATGP